MILGDILSRNASLMGSQPAILFEGRELSHRTLFDRVCRLANALLALGVRRQDRIAFLGQNCPEILETFGACAHAGFIAVGVNYRLSGREQIAILNDAAPSVFVFEQQYSQRAAEIIEGLERRPTAICIGDGGSDRIVNYEAAILAASSNFSGVAQEDDLAFLIYTSGTTGKPKGVMLTHHCQLAQAQICNAAYSVRSTDRFLLVMPLYHIGALHMYLAYAWSGATIVLHRSFDPSQILGSLETDHCTATLLAPVMIQSILDQGFVERSRLPDLHTILYSSAPMPLPLLKRSIDYFGPVLTQVYGATEIGIATCLQKESHRTDGSELDRKRLGSAGQPYYCCEVVVRGEEGTPCASMEIGEVTVRSPAIMRGYWNNMIATHEAIRDGWYYTGDMGYLDEDHFLYLVDRKKDMIISGGENIYSREVEEALLTHVAVREVAVFGVPDEKWGETVAALVVCSEDAQKPSATALIEHCRSLIASYKKPSLVIFIDALPRVSSTGKIDKKAMRDPEWLTRQKELQR
jgi:acyl-CoA synthetase (AMP-forming)/AMP-acid ligase II